MSQEIQRWEYQHRNYSCNLVFTNAHVSLDWGLEEPSLWTHNGRASLRFS